MDEGVRSGLRFVAVQLAFVVGLLHLTLGLFNWLRWLQAGFLLPRDVRWPLFVISGLAVLGGIYLGARATDRRPFYAIGIVVMLGYVVGYFGWHLSGHRPLLLFGPGIGGETITVRWFLDHLFAGPVETVAVFSAGLAAVAMLSLLATE